MDTEDVVKDLRLFIGEYKNKNKPPDIDLINATMLLRSFSLLPLLRRLILDKESMTEIEKQELMTEIRRRVAPSGKEELILEIEKHGLLPDVEKALMDLWERFRLRTKQ